MSAPEGRFWIICGGRDQRLSPIDRMLLSDLADNEGPPARVIHGDARGVDRDAGAWAEKSNFPVKAFPARWEELGRRAGPLRNQAMADYCRPGDFCIAFPGGAGTADMVRRATARGLRIFDWRNE